MAENPFAKYATQEDDNPFAKYSAGESPGKAVPVVIQQEPEQPFVVRAGNTLREIPRQLGLTARYAIEGPAQAAQVFTEPIRILTDAAWNAVRPGEQVRGKTAGELATGLADLIGLPKPENATERVVGDASRLMSGTGATMGLGSAGSGLSGLVGKTFSSIAANPTQQLSAAAGAGLAGGSVREAGGGPLEQSVAALAGGVVGGMAPGAADSVVSRVKSVLGPKPDVDQQISVILQRQGLDFSGLPQNVQSALRSELGDALRAGRELDPAAVRRLADFRMVGATPTRGMVTQNPIQITREQNLAKIAANSSDESLSGLPLVQNRNNARLIDVMNESGAAQGDPFAAGQVTLGAIKQRDEQLRQGVNAAYDNAKSVFGRDVPLDRQTVIGAIWDKVNAEQKGAFFPKELKATINRISSGKEPFTVGVLDNLETMLATASRSTQDGNVKRAIQLAREAILDTPITPVKDLANSVGSAPASVMQALREARAAARGRFEWQASSKPISAALDDMEPDKFFQRFVVGGTVADAQSIARFPQAIEPTKNAIMDFLKSKALSGASDEVGKFSQAAYNKALQQIGERKLALFFSPEEVAQLKAVGRVASYMQVQPVGSAVNNSNTAGMILGRGYDGLRWLANKVPFGKAAILDPVQNIEATIRTRQMQNIVPGLLVEQPKTPAYERLIAPTIAGLGGLLSAP